MEKDKDYTIQEIYDLVPSEKDTTVRGRVYRHLGKLFEKVDKGVYRIKSDNGAEGLVINGCGRKLEQIKNESVDAIYADHPWSDNQLKGGNRNFAKGYEEGLFKYTQEDFDSKFRVLKDGGFLVENLPEENERNFQYLYDLKMMAIKAGFRYYAMVLEEYYWVFIGKRESSDESRELDLRLHMLQRNFMDISKSRTARIALEKISVL